MPSNNHFLFWSTSPVDLLLMLNVDMGDLKANLTSDKIYVLCKWTLSSNTLTALVILIARNKKYNFFRDKN